MVEKPGWLLGLSWYWPDAVPLLPQPPRGAEGGGEGGGGVVGLSQWPMRTSWVARSRAAAPGWGVPWGWGGGGGGGGRLMTTEWPKQNSQSIC